MFLFLFFASDDFLLKVFLLRFSFGLGPLSVAQLSSETFSTSVKGPLGAKEKQKKQAKQNSRDPNSKTKKVGTAGVFCLKVKSIPSQKVCGSTRGYKGMLFGSP